MPWLAASLAVSCVAFGCDLNSLEPKEVTVDQLRQMLKQDPPPRIYDANGERTRREYGIIPGATLLASSSDYPLDLLPEDKGESLVFYCASTWCGAAENAAERAMEAGYAAVSVLPDGIKGWQKAGLPTQPVD